MAPFAEGGSPLENFASTREAGHVIHAWVEGQVGRWGLGQVTQTEMYISITPGPSSDQQNQNFQKPSICFSQSIIFLPLSLTNDLDGLGLGHLALAMEEGELGTKDNVFLPWSLRDTEDQRLPGHRDRQTGHHIPLDPRTWLCSL